MMASRVSRVIPASPERIFDVLSNGWAYSAWVVGASHVRAVQDEWPAVGATIHHSVGLWPAVVQDVTNVIECSPPRRLVLDVAIWFIGRGTVDLTLTPHTGDRTEVVMFEEMHEGVLAKLPDAVVDPLLGARNRETLQRLEALALRPTAPPSDR
jgi:uncharacterized protein YndB with AHSA1/START domain